MIMSTVVYACVVVAVMCLSCCTSVQGVCPAGWQHFNESCYYFVAAEMTWKAAETDCYRHGSRLVKIENSAENEYLRQYLANNTRHFSGRDMWLGGRKDSLGSWEWADNTPMRSELFNDWQSGHPQNADLNVCLEFEYEFQNHWNDDYCDEFNFSICERPFEPLTPPTPVG